MSKGLKNEIIKRIMKGNYLVIKKKVGELKCEGMERGREGGKERWSEGGRDGWSEGGREGWSEREEELVVKCN